MVGMHTCVVTAGDFSLLNDFKMSTLKPMMPEWLFAGWSRISSDPDLVIRGWDSCGLRCMFDERRAAVVKQAKAAAYNESNKFYPLFPNSGIGAPPPDADDDAVKEPLAQPVSEPVAHQTIEELQEQLKQDDPGAVQHVEQLLAEAQASASSPPAAPAAAVIGRKRICPLFVHCASKRARADASASGDAGASNSARVE